MTKTANEEVNVGIPDTAVACTLTGRDLAAQAERWKALRAEVGVAREPTDDGLRLTFRDEPGVVDELHALVAVENECCRWAKWEVSHEEGVLVMHAGSTGDGVVALHGMFGDAG